MKPTSFLIRIGHTHAQAHQSHTVYSGTTCSLSVHTPNDSYIQYQTTEEGFTVFFGESTKTPLAALTGKAPGQGTLIQYNETSGTLQIDTDQLGTAILYYGRDNNGTLELSNRLDNLNPTGKAPDWPAIQQYLNTGYTIGASTFFEAVAQTLPNQTLTAEKDNTWHLIAAARKVSQANPISESELERLIGSVSDRLLVALRARPTSVIMASAGWDSRTLLVNGPGHYHTAYTHGDLSSREVSIAQRLTGGLRMDHQLCDLQNLEITTALLDTMLDELGFCIFPTWYLAGKNIQRNHAAPLSSGVLGEFMGGHYGVLSVGSRVQKALASVSLLSDRLVGEEQLSKALDAFTTPAPGHWFLSAEGHEMLADSASTTKARMQKHLNTQYEETGDWQTALEAFNMEHRARQYILKQAQASASTSGYIAPFADDQLTETVRSIPFIYRVHNKLNQRLLKNIKPELLKYPMAATLISAKYPIVFQELSRGARILFEHGRKVTGISKLQLGWFNYEHLYKTDLLYHITDSLTAPQWDLTKMHNTLKNNPVSRVDAGSTLDMLCKIKTVDHYLAQDFDQNHH